MYTQTRGHYDLEHAKAQAIESEKPMRYINDSLISKRALTEVNPEDINISSQLREAPTRLNYHNKTETSLYGTAPYMANGIQDPKSEINVESDLIFGTHENTCRRTLTEQQFYRPEYLDIPVLEDSNLRGRSTRTDMRNEYRKFNCYRQKT